MADTWSGSSEDQIFFIYDQAAMKTEYDTLEDAILFYHPKAILNDDEVYLLIGQLAGMVSFTKAISCSIASVIKLEKNKFAVIQWSKYLLVLGCDAHAVPDEYLKHKLRRFYDIFAFYHGSIDRLCKDHEVMVGGFANDFVVACMAFLQYAGSYGNALDSIFCTLANVKFGKATSSIYLKVARMLEACQRRDFIHCGCLISESRVVCSQLPTDIVRYLMVLKPHQSHHPAVLVSPGFDVPYGVRILRVYLTQEQYSEILRTSLATPYGASSGAEPYSAQRSKLADYLQLTQSHSKSDVTDSASFDSASRVSEKVNQPAALRSNRRVSAGSLVTPFDATRDLTVSSGASLRNFGDPAMISQTFPVLFEVPECASERVPDEPASCSQRSHWNDLRSKLSHSSSSTAQGCRIDPPPDRDEPPQVENIAVPHSDLSLVSSSVAPLDGIVHPGESVEPLGDQVDASHSSLGCFSSPVAPRDAIVHSAERVEPPLGEKVNVLSFKDSCCLMPSSKSDVLPDVCSMETMNGSAAFNSDDVMTPAQHDAQNSSDRAHGTASVLGDGRLPDVVEEEAGEFANVTDPSSANVDDSASNVDDSASNVDDSASLLNARLDSKCLAGASNEAGSGSLHQPCADGESVEAADSLLNCINKVDDAIDVMSDGVTAPLVVAERPSSCRGVDNSVGASSSISSPLSKTSDVVARLGDDRLRESGLVDQNRQEIVSKKRAFHRRCSSWPGLGCASLRSHEDCSFVESLRGNPKLRDAGLTHDDFRCIFGSNFTSILEHHGVKCKDSQCGHVFSPRAEADTPRASSLSVGELLGAATPRGISDAAPRSLFQTRDMLPRESSSFDMSSEVEDGSGANEHPPDDMQEVHLYVQAHSNTVLLLLMQPQVTYDQRSLKSLWEMALPQLGDIEAQVKSILSIPEKKDLPLDFAYLKYTKLKENYETNVMDTVSAQDRVFVDAVNSIHQQFSQCKTLTDVTYRNHSTAVYGHQVDGEEMFFEARGEYRPSHGHPSGCDSAWKLDHAAPLKLRKHKIANLLI